MTIDINTLLGNYQMQTIVILLAVDVVLGVIAAIVKKDFVFSKIGNFMKGPILAYVLGFAVIERVGEALPKLVYFAYIVPAVFVLVVIALLASILKNLGKLGLPLPGLLKK